MRFLLDQGLPRSAAKELTKCGHESVHAGDIGLGTASDLAILDYAQANGQVVVTLDADFHAIVALSGRTRPSVVRIRMQGVQSRQLIDILLRVIASCAQELHNGAIVTIDESTVRLRRLPLIRA